MLQQQRSLVAAEHAPIVKRRAQREQMEAQLRRGEEAYLNLVARPYHVMKGWLRHGYSPDSDDEGVDEETVVQAIQQATPRLPATTHDLQMEAQVCMSVNLQCFCLGE